MRIEALALLACATLELACATTQEISLDCVSKDVAVYVDGRLLKKHPEALDLRADQPHKLYFKSPGREPQLVVLEAGTDEEGRARLEPADVCTRLVPIPVDRELEIDVEDGSGATGGGGEAP